MKSFHYLIAGTLLVCLLFLPFTVLRAQTIPETEMVALQLEGFPSSLQLRVPETFSLPQSPAQQVIAEDHLAAIGSNRVLQGNYAEVLKAEWQTWPGNVILVYGMASLQNLQGDIKESDWEEIRASFKGMRGQEGLPGTPGVVLADQSVTLFGSSRLAVRGESKRMFSATKMMYREGYVLSMQVLVDGSVPGSRDRIRDYAWLLDIKL